MADLAIEFKNEGLYGDEIKIQISVGEVSKVSLNYINSLLPNETKKNCFGSSKNWNGVL